MPGLKTELSKSKGRVVRCNDLTDRCKEGLKTELAGGKGGVVRCNDLAGRCKGGVARFKYNVTNVSSFTSFATLIHKH